MTEKNAAQPADQEIEAIMEQAQVFASAWAFLGGPFDNGSGLEQAEREKSNLRALLSKLRAPVADERITWIADYEPLYYFAQNNKVDYNALCTAVRAALASAPVAGEAKTDVNAAMAAEYQRWIDYYHQGRDYDDFLRECVYGHKSAPMDISSGHSDAIDTSPRCVEQSADHRHDAAPQASAEDVTRDLVALVVKLARSIRKSDPAMYGMALDFLKRHNLQGSPLRGESTTPPTGPTQAQCKAAAEIARGFGARHLADVLDPPQADKDGGQQRAGDAERWRWATATDENAQMLCTIVQAYGGDQQKINERADFYRAALSATQAEQGERDA
ncbi:hypothetical protein ACOTJS_19350 [Achromobacter xylosoxidans]